MGRGGHMDGCLPPMGHGTIQEKGSELEISYWESHFLTCFGKYERAKIWQTLPYLGRPLSGNARWAQRHLPFGSIGWQGPSKALECTSLNEILSMKANF